MGRNLSISKNFYDDLFRNGVPPIPKYPIRGYPCHISYFSTEISSSIKEINGEELIEIELCVEKAGMAISYLKESSFELNKPMIYKDEIYIIRNVRPSDNTLDTILYIERTRPIPKEVINNSIGDLEV